MKLRRRVAWFAFLLIGLVLGAVVALWTAAPTHRINRETIGDLHESLSLAEVEAFLHVPPGDYRTRDIKTIFLVPVRPGWKQVVWHGNEGAILARFDGDDRLVHAVFVPREAGQDTFAEKVFRRLRLQ